VRRVGHANYAEVWRSLETQLPDHDRRARERRQSAERLRGELLAGPAELWLGRLGDPRYQNPDLLEHLLEVCHSALPLEPIRGFEVSEVALNLGGLLCQTSSDQDLAESLCRANCLGSHACRLLGKHERAEALLGSAAFLAHNPVTRGFFCRACASLRWDQGRMDEAEALLHHAGRCYYEVGDAKEGAACFALLGLLYSEEEELSRAEHLLRNAKPGLDNRSHPWLTAEAYLALARCSALARRKAVAVALRQSAWRLVTSVPPEAVSFVWRDAQVAEALGDLAEAEQRFDSVRRKYIEKGYLPEASISSIHLARVLVRLGRGEETCDLDADLAEAFAGRPGLDLSLSMLQGLRKEAAATGNVEEEIWRFMPPTLLLSYRLRGIYSQPVPFV